MKALPARGLPRPASRRPAASAGRVGGDGRGDPRGDPDRAGEPGIEGRGPDGDVRAGLRRLEHLPVAEVDGQVRDVAGSRGVGVVEEQVAGLQLADGNLRPGARLVGGHPRHDDARLRQRPLHQAGAVEHPGPAAAPHIRQAQPALRGGQEPDPPAPAQPPAPPAPPAAPFGQAPAERAVGPAGNARNAEGSTPGLAVSLPFTPILAASTCWAATTPCIRRTAAAMPLCNVVGATTSRSAWSSLCSGAIAGVREDRARSATATAGDTERDPPGGTIRLAWPGPGPARARAGPSALRGAASAAGTLPAPAVVSRASPAPRVNSERRAPSRIRTFLRFSAIGPGTIAAALSAPLLQHHAAKAEHASIPKRHSMAHHVGRATTGSAEPSSARSNSGSVTGIRQANSRQT